mgnify:FL=1|jgi:hypothetical protein
MRATNTASLKEVVRHQKGGKSVRNIKKFEGYVNTVSHLHQRGFEFFQEEYVNSSLMSKDHRRILEDSRYRDEILSELGVHSARNKPPSKPSELAADTLSDLSVDDSRNLSSSDEEPPMELLRQIEEENMQ